MTTTELFEKILGSFQAYYNIQREDESALFAASAEFHSHDEQYFLVRSARISEAESNEYVYFAIAETLDSELLQKFDQNAWTEGISRITPHKDHRNSDISLFIIADKIEESAFAQIPKLKHYKSYLWGLQGWTNYRLVAIEATSGRTAYNRQGRDWKKLICNILNHS